MIRMSKGRSPFGNTYGARFSELRRDENVKLKSDEKREAMLSTYFERMQARSEPVLSTRVILA